MSDVHVAAPSGGAPPPAVSNEVAVNENSVHVPNPVGAQAPDKPVGDIKGSEHRPPSRRETIQAAFEKAAKQQDEGTQRTPVRREPPKERPAAEAKTGHNNPPEETKPERQAQPREAGRFARAPDQQPQPDQATGQQATAQPQQRPQLPEGTPYRDPLPRMSERAKAEWSAAPESVRGEVHRMAQEFRQGYERSKADVEAMKPIRRFHEMATQQGTTLEKALHNYVSMEQKLREDVVGGLDVIVRNLGLKGPDGQRLGVRDVAYHILNMTPDQHRLTQTQNSQTAAQNQIGELHQQIEGLKTAIHQMHNAQQFTSTRGAVDQFAEQHPRFDELGDLIENEIKLGFPLEQAYRRAELLRPATQAAQTRSTSTSAQTRQPDRSISGAPDGGPSDGSSAQRPRKDQPTSRRDAIQGAIRRVNGGL